MVFKRYIKRHGKKLGPYYYENVRSRDGKVKSVYVGANPHQHPKHKIRKPLFFLILALVLILVLGGSLFLLQNKSYVVSKVRHEEPDFEVDQILLKVLVRQNEFIEKQLRVTNIGDGAFSLNADVQGLSDLVNVDSKAFTIKPGQTKILLLNFSSFIAAENIEQQPGIYVGKLAVSSEKGLIEIPIIVEIETKNILFDMNLNPVAIERRVKQGTDTTIEVRLFNLESIESQNVDVEYFVKDMNGNTIVTESETVVVKTQASFFKTISIPKNLKPGPYVFAGRSKFGNSVGTSSYLFEVVGPEPESFAQFCKDSILCLGLSLSTVLLIIAMMAYFYFFMGAYIYEKVTGIEILESRKERVKERGAEIFEEAKPSFFERLNARLRKRKKEKEIKVKKEAIEKPKTSFASGIKNRLGKWLEEREKRKQEKERLEREKELEAIIKEKGQEIKEPEEKQSRELRKFYSILDDAYNALKSEDVQKLDRLYARTRNIYDLLSGNEQQQAYEKLVELYNKRNELMKKLEQAEEQKRKQDELKRREEELKREKELERKRKEEIEKQKSEERKKLWSERKKNVKRILHQFGLYKTAEEKRQRALQKEIQRKEKERKKLEELRIREQNRLQLEIEEKKKQDKIRQKQIEEEKRKQEELQKQEKERKRQEVERQKAERELKQQREAEEKRKQEEAERKEEERKQIELEKKQKEQERTRLEEEKRQKHEEEKKRKEIERQNREKLRAERLDAIRQFETELNKNEEQQNELKNQVRNLENELKEHPKRAGELDNSVKNLDSQISRKSRQLEELDQQKASASEDFKRKIAELEEKEQQEENARDAKISELRQKLAGRQASMLQEMEQELDKLSPAKRKATEKWKKLEIKAKLKIEEQNIKDEIAEYEGKFKEEKIRLESDSKIALSGISKSQRQLRKEIEDLSGQKEQALREKESISSGIDNKKDKIQEIKSKIEALSNKRDEIKSSLRKAKSELHVFGFLSSMLPIRRRKSEAPAQYWEEKQKSSEDDMLREIEEKIKAREEERKAKEERKRLKQEENIRAKEEKKRQGNIEKEQERQEGPKKRESWLGKIFRKKSPEEAAKAERQAKEEKEISVGELLKEEKAQEKPKSKEAEFKPARPKSRKLEKCYKTIDHARDSINRNKIGDGKKLYLEARSLYLELEYHEKKEVYDELMDLYNRLIR